MHIDNVNSLLRICSQHQLNRFNFHGPLQRSQKSFQKLIHNKKLYGPEKDRIHVAILNKRVFRILLEGVSKYKYRI